MAEEISIQLEAAAKVMLVSLKIINHLAYVIQQAIV